jgi:hypothetical protein
MKIYELMETMNITMAFAQTEYSCGHRSSAGVIDEDFEVEDYNGYYVHTLGKKECLIFLEPVDRLCFDCEDERKELENRVYIDELEQPVGFDKVTLYHGLYAFETDINCDFDPEDCWFLDPDMEIEEPDHTKQITSNFNTIKEHPEYQICTSTSAIGEIGLILKGDVLVASNIDLYSQIDFKRDNRRYITKDTFRAEGIIYDAKDLEKKWDHDEIIVQNTIIDSIWVKDDTDNKYKELAIKLAKENDLKLIIIK